MNSRIGLAAALALAAMGAVSSAMAADLPPHVIPAKAPVMIPAEWDWTGFYVGGNVGYSWGHSDNDWSFFSPTAIAASGSNAHKLDGFIGGGQIGYNRQIAGWVLGLEADIQGSAEKGTNPNICVAAGGGGCATTNYSITQSIEWFGTFRGRVGYLVTPNWLVYATAGLAYGEVQTDVTLAANGGLFNASGKSTRVGWTAGAGIEGALSQNWSAKIEYLYVDLGTVTGSYPIFPQMAISYGHDSHITDHILRAGVNYRFGGPIIARY